MNEHVQRDKNNEQYPNFSDSVPDYLVSVAQNEPFGIFNAGGEPLKDVIRNWLNVLH